jgi:nucleotide-binding universal stress UspA family protein
LCDDGSDLAALAVQTAGALLAGREAIALHVWRPVSTEMLVEGAGTGAVALPPEVDDQVRAAASEAAERAADRARKAGFQATPLASEAVGPVWETILEVARDRDAEVIVLGARGLTGFQRALLGSVSERVVRHADRPVLVSHPRSDKPSGSRPDAA